MNGWRNSNSQLHYLKQRFIFHMIILILALHLNVLLPIECYPINNGFTLKFTPISVRDEMKETAETHGSKFTKIPQKNDLDSKSWQKILAEPDIFADMLRNGNTNQIAKLLLPTTRRKYHIADESRNTFVATNDFGTKSTFTVTSEPDLKTKLKTNLMQTETQSANINRNIMINSNVNLPLMKQPHNSYKMLIATSPPNFKLGDSEQPILLYVVFPDEEGSIPGQVPRMPTVYFVKQSKPKPNKKNEEQLDPIFIVDHNRTVTGIKSREVPKYLTFRSKYLKRKEVKFT